MAATQRQTEPPISQIASALDLAAENALPPGYPSLVGVPSVPTVLLKAIAWVESRWHQFQSTDEPLISTDGGFGVMQVTHGLGGAPVTPPVQSAIAYNFVYNIASGAYILSSKWLTTPRIGTGDPSVIEDWYYAVWAYNAWGWKNNPNNPIFTRKGNPETNPRAFPYQERVFYAISHPPLDRSGKPLWTAVPVALPDRAAIGKTPGPLTIAQSHYDVAPNDSPLLLQHFDLSQFESDLTIPDGTLVAPGAQLRKVWLIRNSGGVFWSGYTWRQVGGDKITAPLSVTVPFVPPLAQVAIGVNIVAPARPGEYKTYWQLTDALGNSVGAPAWIAFDVANILTSTAATLPPSTPVVPGGVLTGTAGLPTAIGNGLARQAGVNNAAYIANLGVPDGAILAPGQVFTKTWEIQNTGTQPWDSRYHWQFEAGAPLSTVRSVTAPALPVGGTVRFFVQMVAPQRPGTYRSFWQMTDPNGVVFGAQGQVSIRVVAPAQSSSSPTAPPTSTRAAATNTPVPTASPTAAPTHTPTTPPTATATPRPTATFTATPRPTATATQVPSPTPAAASLTWFGPPAAYAYYAEGYTGDGYREYLSLLNPHSTITRAQLTLYRIDGATEQLALRLAPQSRRSLYLNALAPGSATALSVVSDSALVTERGEFTRNGEVVAGAGAPAQRWYVADGYVGNGYRDSLRIFNPSPLPAGITIYAYRGDGSVLISHRLVSPGTRANIMLNDIAPIGPSAIEVDSSQPTVVESVVDKVAGSGPGGALALPELSSRWYFTDGGTGAGNQEYIVLLNPGLLMATVHLALVTSNGELPALTLHVQPHSRAVYVVHRLIRTAGLAALVSSDQPVAAQELRYTTTGATTMVDGSTVAARRWGLAEGHTGDGFKQWLTFFNPGDRGAKITVRLITKQGTAYRIALHERPRHRDYLYINGLIHAGPVSALISADRPIVAGRTMIFNSGRGLSTTVGVPLAP